MSNRETSICSSVSRTLSVGLVKLTPAFVHGVYTDLVASDALQIANLVEYAPEETANLALAQAWDINMAREVGVLEVDCGDVISCVSTNEPR